jgi:hypothetical protein
MLLHSSLILRPDEPVKRIIMTAAVSGGIRLRRVTFFSSLPSASSSVITSSPVRLYPHFFRLPLFMSGVILKCEKA